MEIIRNCYDSHTHFWATGQVASGLRLHTLKRAEDVLHLKIEDGHRRAGWIVGFGWNQNNWESPELPDRHVLDRAFPETPVFFSRVDGHASWINSAAVQELRRLGYGFHETPSGGHIARDKYGEPTGLLMDQAHIAALHLLPDFSPGQHRSFLQSAQRIFNQAGFTHVRDLSMNSYFWRVLREMEKQHELTVFLDCFVTAESLADSERVLADIKAMQMEPSRQLRLHGVKIFIDGSLGSQTAHLSESYSDGGGTGLLIWSEEEIKELLRRVWGAGQQVAIHTIGDQAVHTAVCAARAVSASGISGRLHLEHVQLLRPETLKLMKPLHITCHMQPCHWLSDHSWLRRVLPPSLISGLFPWEALRKNKIPFDFGSDSPIEVPSLANTRRALEQSAGWGVPALRTDWKEAHSHPDRSWGDCRTELEDDRVRQVYFQNRPLL